MNAISTLHRRTSAGALENFVVEKLELEVEAKDEAETRARRLGLLEHSRRSAKENFAVMSNNG